MAQRTAYVLAERAAKLAAGITLGLARVDQSGWSKAAPSGSRSGDRLSSASRCGGAQSPVPRRVETVRSWDGSQLDRALFGAAADCARQQRGLDIADGSELRIHPVCQSTRDRRWEFIVEAVATDHMAHLTCVMEVSAR